MEQQFLRTLIQVRVGTDQEPRRRTPVEAERQCRHGNGSGRPRSLQASPPGDADHRYFFASRSRVRKNLAALLRESNVACRCVCAGVVQADASRYGTARTLPRTGNSEGTTTLAGPCPSRKSCIG